MGFWEFLASVVGSIAWPVAVLSIVYWFRKQITALLTRLRSAKALGAEATFELALDQAEEKGSSVEILPRPQAADLAAPTDFDRIAQISPAAAIVFKWVEIEKSVLTLAPDALVTSKSYQSVTSVMRRLQANGEIGPEAIELFNELRTLRNLAAHPTADGEAITYAQAKRFGDLADGLLAGLHRSDRQPDA